MNLRNIFCAAAGVLALASAGAASAAVTELNFGAPGAQPQIYFTGFVPGTTTVDPHLSATLDLTLTSISAGGHQWNFSYNLANTSTTASRISTIGWDIAPDFLSVVGVGGVRDQVRVDRGADGQVAFVARSTLTVTVAAAPDLPEVVSADLVRHLARRLAGA